MKITFTKDYKVNAEGGESYKAGDVADVEPASVAHFISRGVAVEGEQKKAKPEKKDKKKEA